MGALDLLDGSVRSEISSIKSELYSIASSLDSLAYGIRYDFDGVGNDVCADRINDVSSKCMRIRSALRSKGF